ncbi:MAG: ABC transporter ATP-binding protein/permease [Firmicutes bacterium]|nr:ABC transporter ATP-binding protein/permease [Bacillota bacterium]
MNPLHIKDPGDFSNLSGKDMKQLANRFKGYLKPFMPQFLIGCVAALFYGLSAGVQPYFIKYLMDDVLKKGNYAPLKWLLLAIFASVVIKGIFSYIQGYMLSYAGQSAVRHIRDNVYAHIQSLPISFFEKWQSGQIMYRVITDIHQMTDTFTQAVIVLVADVAVFVFSIGAMFFIDWKLTLIAFLTSPIIAFIMNYFGSLIQKFVSRMQNKISELNSIIQENIGGIKVIKAFGAEDYEKKRFAEINENSFVAIMKSIQFKQTQTPLVEIFGVVGILVIIAFGAYLVNTKPDFTAGSFLTFVTYMLVATSPVNRFSNTYADLRKGFISAARVFELLDVTGEEKDDENAVILDKVTGKVEFVDTKFAYNEKKQILKGVNFAAEPGEMVAVVGPNGAGKTTLVNLIPRFYELTGGSIKVDGSDIRDIKLHSLRRHIGVVLQDTILFSGTIRENIAYGEPEIPMEKVMEAAKIANAHDFIMNLPGGYDAIVGERGVGLSGGQKQRISIARTILRQPEILILDEATSSLDQESEALVQEALENLMKGRTTFVIAHRMNTIKKADKIVVLNQGYVEEIGKHDELMAKNGLYRKLYEAQKLAQERKENA